MRLNTKIACGVSAAVALTAGASLITVYKTSQLNRIHGIEDQMFSILDQASETISKMDEMHQEQVFDYDKLLAQAEERAGSRGLRDVYEDTSLYKTIPVVAAWESARSMAERSGYDFSIVSAPGLRARSAENQFSERFGEAFSSFEAGEVHHVRHDTSTGEIFTAIPVRISESCLSCHGDPSSSPTGDGLDLLGFSMENLKVGDIKGAFVIETRLDHDPVIRDTVSKAAAASGAALLVSLGGFFFFCKRYIERPIESAVEHLESSVAEVGQAADEVSRNSVSLAEGSNEQAAAIEQTSTSLSVMSEATTSNAEMAESARRTAGNAKGVAEIGARNIRKMVDSMQSIKSSSENVSEILKTIDEIAFQTNILALNAAVEAARAGEAGAGFAVVADEVRNLAQRSAKAAAETAEKLEESMRISDSGFALSRDAEKSLAEMLGSIGDVGEMVVRIADSSQEQARSIEQIKASVGQMNSTTQEAAASAEEAASSSEELRNQSEGLKALTLDLRRLVDGKMQPRRIASNPTLGVGESKAGRSGESRRNGMEHFTLN